MDGKFKPKKIQKLLYGDIIINLHTNQNWEVERIGKLMSIKHGIITLYMSEEDTNKYFEERK